MALDIDYSFTAVPMDGKLTSLVLDEDVVSNGKWWERVGMISEVLKWFDVLSF